LTILVFFGIYKGQFWGVSSMSSSFHKLAGTVLAATATFGVALPASTAKATPSIRDCRADDFRVYFDTRNNVLAIDETVNSVDCPVSNEIGVLFHNHPHPITLTKVTSRWVSNPYPIYKGGCYAVDKVYVTPTYGLTPSGRYDQRIVIKSEPNSGYPNIRFCGEYNSHETVSEASTLPHPVAPPPPVVLQQPLRQESRTESSQSHRNGQKTILDVARCISSKLGQITWNGWDTDFNLLFRSIKECFST
jgi:hypothetical protein